MKPIEQTTQIQTYSTSQLIIWYAWHTHATPEEALFCVLALGASEISLEHVKCCYRDVDRIVSDDDALAPKPPPPEVITILHVALVIHRHGRALLGLATTNTPPV